jgi:hypothetical protein
VDRIREVKCVNTDDRGSIVRVWIEGDEVPVEVPFMDGKHNYQGRDLTNLIIRAASPVVPAQPGWTALYYCRDGDKEWIDRSPIHAWYVTTEGTEPVVNGGVGEDSQHPVCTQGPDGRIWDHMVGDGPWENEEEFLNRMRELRKWAEETADRITGGVKASSPA